MTTINVRIRRSAYAALWCIIYILGETEAFGRFIGHLHRAFTCAAIELAVLIPIHMITYLSTRQRAPRLLERLAHFVINALWTEVACSCITRWVHLFVVQGSSSRLPAGAPTASSTGGLDTFKHLFQGVAFLCIVQIIYDMNFILRKIQEKVESIAYNEVAATRPAFDSESYSDVMFDRLLYLPLTGGRLLYDLLVHISTAMAIYLQRMAIGMWVTGLVDAYHTLPAWGFCIIAACALFLLITIIVYVRDVYEEFLADEEARISRRLREAVFAVRFNRAAFADENARLVRWINAIEAVLAEEDAGLQERARMLRQLREVLAEFHQLGQLRRGQPLPRARRQPPALYDTVAEDFRYRAIGSVIECVRHLLPRRYAPHITRLYFPELAALWPEGERARFYAGLLAGGPASSAVGVVLMEHGALRRRDYEDLWRRAGLTTDFVLGVGETGVSVLGGESWSGMIPVWGNIARTLVCVLEVIFIGHVYFIVAAVIQHKWLGMTRRRATQ